MKLFIRCDSIYFGLKLQMSSKHVSVVNFFVLLFLQELFYDRFKNLFSVGNQFLLTDVHIHLGFNNSTLNKT